MEIRGPGNIDKAHKIETTRRTYKADGMGQMSPMKSGDTAEFTEISQLLSKLSSAPEIRNDRVEAVRQEIERGEYLTDDKLDAAANRLFDLLD